MKVSKRKNKKNKVFATKALDTYQYWMSKCDRLLEINPLNACAFGSWKYWDWMHKRIKHRFKGI